MRVQTKEKLQRKLTNQEWDEVNALGPGIHNFRGINTLIYNGRKCWKKSQDKNTGKILLDNVERDSIEIIIILPGVYTIQGSRFYGFNVKTVIMSDTVKRIEKNAFHSCIYLRFVKLSRNIEYIGEKAFSYCHSLTSIFVPESCEEIDDYAFQDCSKLIIFNLSDQETRIRYSALLFTALQRVSKSSDGLPSYWIKSVNIENEFYLHRECASMNPSEEIIYSIFKKQGRQCFQLKNDIGITASRYLYENPYTDITEQKLINRRVLDMMGEIIN
ncbi:leucine-rich repeat domain-containing protein [Chaetoceros tenuissimus]|uniref:Leucine-rich repeat domain-containing protein n=1 Tax=Chaetoceros tenuissimus TaxID=426638 RepID=A0AAD3HB32_9STRA|nr:leucine-rich repeat domain-containing protein [Chaetoceros tenuissimus]